jgi:hypothetical protein
MGAVSRHVHASIVENDYTQRKTLVDLLHDKLNQPVTSACPFACLGLPTRIYQTIIRRTGPEMTIGQLAKRFHDRDVPGYTQDAHLTLDTLRRRLSAGGFLDHQDANTNR